MLNTYHRAQVSRENIAHRWQEPQWAWIFMCHEIHLHGKGGAAYICGEGTYRSFERAWKCLKMHALGKHDFVL